MPGSDTPSLGLTLMNLLNCSSKTLFISVCLVFSVQSALGQSLGKESLTGLDGVKVAVSVDEEAKEAGLYQETLKSNTELQLRKADIEVYTEENFTNTQAAPALFISVSTYKHESGLLAYVISTEMTQTVYTTAGKRVSGTTWKTSGAIGMVGVKNVRDLIDNIEQEVRIFINDWLSVHE